MGKPNSKKQKKRKERLKVETSKLQKVMATIMVSYLILINLVFLSFEEPSDTFSIFVTISEMVVIFGGMIVILIENSKLVKRAKLRAELEEKKHNEEDRELYLYSVELSKLDLKSASKEDKAKYVYYSLYQAILERAVSQFYIRCYDLTFAEIKEALFSVRVSDEFKSFIERVLLRFKLSNELNRFHFEIETINRHLLLGEELDETFYLKNFFYNRLRYLRAYYYYDEKKKRYFVKSECYSNYYGYFKWVEMMYKGKYRKEEKAIAKCKKIINRKSDKDYIFNVPIDVKLDKFRDAVLWHLSNEGKLEQPYLALSKYLEDVSSDGHLGYFDFYESEGKAVIKQNLSYLKEILPKDIYSALSAANREKTNPAKLAYADKMVFDNSSALQKILDDYIKSLDIRILQDAEVYSGYTDDNLISVETKIPFCVSYAIIDTLDHEFIDLLKAHKVKFGVFKRDGFRNGNLVISLFTTFKKNQGIIENQILPELDYKLRWKCEKEYEEALKIFTK